MEKSGSGTPIPFWLRASRSGPPSRRRDPPRRSVVTAISGALARGRAEEAGRLEDQDHDQEAEDDDLLPARVDVVGIQADHDPEDDAADRGALQVADPAEDRGGERLQAERRAVEPPRLAVIEGDDQAGSTGARPGQEERQRDRPVDVDAHEAGRLAVLGHGPHRLALAGVRDEPDEGEEQRDRDRRHEDVAELDVNLAEEDEYVGGRQDARAGPLDQRDRRGPQDLLAGVLEDE